MSILDKNSLREDHWTNNPRFKESTMTNPIDLSKLTIPNAQLKFHDPRPNNIIFYNTAGGAQVEVLRISALGITANPDVPTDEAADAVIRALDGHIKNLTQRTWVGLTDEEIDELHGSPMDLEHSGALKWVRIIEAKLKEKNT
jgi:hypothetical protein